MRLPMFAWGILSTILCLGTNALAQTASGSISGVVQDESAAVVPGAQVMITYHLARQSDPNTRIYELREGGVKFYPATGPRKNPVLGGARFISSDASSAYESLQLDFVQRLSHGLRSKISYTFSKNIDNASALISQHAQGQVNATQDPDNLKGDRGLSAFDIRNNFVMNFTYDVPTRGLSGAAGKVLGGGK